MRACHGLAVGFQVERVRGMSKRRKMSIALAAGVIGFMLAAAGQAVGRTNTTLTGAAEQRRYLNPANWGPAREVRCGEVPGLAIDVDGTWRRGDGRL